MRPAKIDKLKIDVSRFTLEHYNHIKMNGFNPKICSKCQTIDIILMKQVLAEARE